MKDRLLKNALWGAGQLVTNVLLVFISIPLIIKIYGAAFYGLFSYVNIYTLFVSWWGNGIITLSVQVFNNAGGAIPLSQGYLKNIYCLTGLAILLVVLLFLCTVFIIPAPQLLSAPDFRVFCGSFFLSLIFLLLGQPLTGIINAKGN